jgi:hypothetical protein
MIRSPGSTPSVTQKTADLDGSLLPINGALIAWVECKDVEPAAVAPAAAAIRRKSRRETGRFI